MAEPLSGLVKLWMHQVNSCVVFEGVRPAKPQSQVTGPGGRQAAGAGGGAAGEGGEMHRGRPQTH